MIRARLLCVAGLLAGVACSATSTATETASQPGSEAAQVGEFAPGADQPDQEAVPVPEAAAPTGATGGPAIAAGPDTSLQDLLDEVRDRIASFVPGALQTLDEVLASFDGARAHAQSVFARLASLRIVFEEAGRTGAALDELNALEQEAVSLNETAETLQADLHGQQVELRDLTTALAGIEVQLASGEPSPAALRDLDAEVLALQGAGSVRALEKRSDKLVSRVAMLVSRVDGAERKMSAVIENGAAGTDATALTGSVGAAVSTSMPPAVIDEDDEDDMPVGEIAEVITNKGTLLLQFFPDVAPAHVQNFKRLVRDGFYDGLTFHRLLPGYILQGGCPRGDGFGGPGWQLDNEFNRRTHRRGTLSMARFAHPDSAGSQFFICLDDRPELDGKQTVFGRVIRGEDTLQAIEALGDPDGSGKPVEPIIIQQIILRPWQQGDNEASMIAENPVR
jgi:cyclophilin family peptidyl-prolyl cis-trans isomerase